MRVRFERTGGFAGRHLAAVFETDDLAGDDAIRLRQLVDEAGFFDLASGEPAPGPGADRFRYTLTVDSRDRRHTVSVTDGSIPAGLAPLVDWLTEAARRA